MAMKVYFPFGGRWFVLRWYEHNEGTHLIIAKSEAQMADMVRRLLREEPYAEIRGYSEIEMLAPSLAMEEFAQRVAEKNAEDGFWTHIRWRVRDYITRHGELPPPVRKCPGYQTDDTDENEETDEEHYYCSNCDHGYVVTDSREEFYRARRSMYEAEFMFPTPEHDGGKYRAVKSRARRAADDEPLWVAAPHFGHHCAGVVMDQVDMDWSLRGADPIFTGPSLFFGKLIRDVDASEFVKMFKEAQRKLQEDREEKDRLWQQERVQEYETQDRGIVRLLKGP